jgi:formate hydrogenlyase subunit 3/multisubunit Na+/H+ antiporter MnhD subunit
VIIKIGVFGIFRMLMVINLNFTIVGFFIILISIITGLYGVMMTVIQNNLKKLLAYCSIENIGIIGIGIGLGCLGKGTNHPSLIFAGFGGALLHVLNHSLFKSLLFYNAGNIYLATHSLNINSLGGLLKSIPKTGYLFLIGALAICGLPPFNGFISEYFIYRGLFDGINSNQSLSNLFLLFSIFALVLIGGLALIAFTKSFGMIFLGKGRDELPVDKTIDGTLGIIPQCIIVVAILLIGLFPFLLSPILIKTTSLFNNSQDIVSSQYIGDFLGDVKEIGFFSLFGIILVVSFLYLRRFLTKKHSKKIEETWGCAYVAPIPRAQYSGSSYSRTFEMLFNFIVKGSKSNENIPKEQLYPKNYKFSTFNDDFWEKYIITPPLKWFSFLLNKFKFIQNGKIQSYVIYGLTFIVVVIVISMLSIIQLKF